MALLGWQVAVPANAYIFAQQILALISVCQPNYVIQGWQASLITIGSATSAIALSVFVMQKLTLAEGLAVVAHVFGLVIFLAILWVMGPRAGEYCRVQPPLGHMLMSLCKFTDAHATFFHFQNQSGWSSKGVATLVGIIGPVATFIGGDSAVHLAEELQDASYILPRAMVTGCGINYIIGLIGLISFLFNIGPIDDSLYKYGGQPWVAVIYRITGSKAATIVLIIVISVCVWRPRYTNALLCVLIAIAVLLPANELRHDVLTAVMGIRER
jgi:amino acid transporter